MGRFLFKFLLSVFAAFMFFISTVYADCVSQREDCVALCSQSSASDECLVRCQDIFNLCVDPLPGIDPPDDVGSTYGDCSQYVPGTSEYEDCMSGIDRNRQYSQCQNEGTIKSQKECERALDKKRCLEDCVGDSEFCDCKCNGGIVLNTNVPFVGRCIAVKSADGSHDAEQLNAFPRLMKGLSRLLLSLILLLSFIMVIAGGVMIASSGANSSGYSQGKKMITKVALGILLLGLMGVILRLINPNFFT